MLESHLSQNGTDVAWRTDELLARATVLVSHTDSGLNQLGHSRIFPLQTVRSRKIDETDACKPTTQWNKYIHMYFNNLLLNVWYLIFNNLLWMHLLLLLNFQISSLFWFWWSFGWLLWQCISLINLKNGYFSDWKKKNEMKHKIFSLSIKRDNNNKTIQSFHLHFQWTNYWTDDELIIGLKFMAIPVQMLLDILGSERQEWEVLLEQGWWSVEFHVGLVVLAALCTECTVLIFLHLLYESWGMLFRFTVYDCSRSENKHN